MLLRLVATFLLGTASLTALANDHTHAHSHASKAQAFEITQVWSRAMPPSAPTGAVYFSLRNPSGQADRLTGAHTPRAERAELHTHVHKGDMMRMEQVEAVEVPADGQVAFEPGGHHVMLFKLSEPLAAGDHFPLTLVFEQAGEVTVEVSVQEQPPQGHGDSHMHH
ncbi:MAG: copper chaperone PCu(A)C [Pseudomonas sp.]